MCLLASKHMKQKLTELNKKQKIHQQLEVVFFFFGCTESLLLQTFCQLQCTGFSLWWLLLLGNTGSRCTGFSSCGSPVLEHSLYSFGTWAQLFPSMWNLPRPGIESMSPALAGRFFFTVPPGKSPLLEIITAVESMGKNLRMDTNDLHNTELSCEVKVAQSCPTLCNPMDYIVHGILQTRILEWVAFPFSRGSSQPRN